MAQEFLLIWITWLPRHDAKSSRHWSKVYNGSNIADMTLLVILPVLLSIYISSLSPLPRRSFLNVLRLPGIGVDTSDSTGMNLIKKRGKVKALEDEIASSKLALCLLIYHSLRGNDFWHTFTFSFFNAKLVCGHQWNRSLISIKFTTLTAAFLTLAGLLTEFPMRSTHIPIVLTSPTSSLSSTMVYIISRLPWAWILLILFLFRNHHQL